METVARVGHRRKLPRGMKLLTALPVLMFLDVSPPASSAAWGGIGGPGTIVVGAKGGGSGGSGSSTGGSPGGSSPWECTYLDLVLNNEGGFPPGGPEPGAWYSVTCDNTVTGAQFTRTEWISSQPPTPVANPSQLAQSALDDLHLPSPAISTNPAGPSVVNLATWLWVSPGLWHTFSVTASADGVSSTATATPVSVTWTMGDGSTVTCPGPGVAYGDAVTTDCSYTYRTSSLGHGSDNRFPVTATIAWAVRWKAVGAAGGGTLPTQSTSSSTSLTVEQIESVDSALPGGVQ